MDTSCKPRCGLPAEMAPMFNKLEGSRYLMNAYVPVSDGWESFRRTGRQSDLLGVASALRPVMATLAADDDFFAGISYLPKVAAAAESPNASAEMAAVRADYERFREVDLLVAHELVAMAPSMPVAHAIRLAADLREQLGENWLPRLAELAPVPAAAGPVVLGPDELRSGVHATAEELSQAEDTFRAVSSDLPAEVAAGQAPHKGFFKAFRSVKTAYKVLVGAATIGSNVAAVVGSVGIATGLGLASVVGGAEAMRSAILARPAEEKGGAAASG